MWLGRWHGVAGVLAWAALASARGAGLTIGTTQIPQGTQWPGFPATDKGAVSSRAPNTFPAPQNGGARTDAADQANLNGILNKDFQCAVKWWQAAIGDDFTINLAFGWDDVVAKGLAGPNTLAVFQSTQRDNKNRSTSGVIRFNNDASIPWFLDDTPPSDKTFANGNTEFFPLQTNQADLGAVNKTINTGRYMAAAQGGDAYGDGQNPVRFDIFSVCLHEIGHALGVDPMTNYDPNANGGFIRVTKDRPAGSDTKDALIDTITNANNGNGAGDVGLHLGFGHAVMYPSLAAGERRFLSAVDILAPSELSDFTNINLDPAGHTPVVPEPLAAATLLPAAALLRRR